MEPRLNDELNWSKSTFLHRSQAGVTTGVYFFEVEKAPVVVKPYWDAQSELLANTLAHAVGLRVPAMRLERAGATYLRRVLKQDKDVPVLVMQRIHGSSFTDVNPKTIQSFTDGSHVSRQRIKALGHICAFDYFIGNSDRFPVRGLNGLNTGNLMVDDTGFVCIDNTLVTPLLLATSTWVKDFKKSLTQALSTLEAKGDPRWSDQALSPIVDFLADAPQASWTIIRAAFLDGFRAGSWQVAGLSTQQLNRAIVTSHRHLKPIVPEVRAFLENNLRAFKKAHSIWGAPPL